MEQDSAPAVPARYRAFISYSHADAGFAGWLHRKLESWRLPDKSRLAPVFIDRAELAAGSDLSAQVRAALADSAALVVVCSPNARASRWVSQEIELFRALHPDRPVLAALIAGEPAEAFPDPLVLVEGRTVEPLAADFREGHDGKRLGLIKIVAGLTRQPLDRLIQRDAQNRQRRVMAVTAGALLLSLVLSTSLVIALRARVEAERQRSEAEGLVEYMLTDLRDKLRGTGDPKIMASVNQKALDYYSHMDVSKLTDDSLDRRARVLHAMGEDNERLGNFPIAQAMYQEAWRITKEVLGRHPDDADAIFAHAQSEYWVGEAAWQQSDLKTAEVHWRGYLVQAEALAKAEPGTKRSLMELGYANGNMCEWTERSGKDINASLPYCLTAKNALTKARALAPEDSTIGIALANRIGWIADVHRRHQLFDASIAFRNQEAKILDTLMRHEKANLEIQERRIWPDIGIAQTLLDKGNAKLAYNKFENCLNAILQLQRKNPENVILAKTSMRIIWFLNIADRQIGSKKNSILKKQFLFEFSLIRSKLPSSQIDNFEKMINDF